MKQRKLSQSINLALGAAVSLGAVAGLTVGVATDAGAGIKDSLHNLGGTSTTVTRTNYVGSADTAEICVFCHTPHGANTAALPAPLWNKAVTAGSSYTVYTGPGTLDGTTSVPQGISLACLSCHDGTQAMDNLINAPGSGGYVSSGQNMAWTWTGNEKIQAGITNIGTDLSNDHPITIQYGGGLASGTWSDGVTSFNDTDFRAVNVTGSRRFVSTASYGGTNNAVVDRTDMILYNTSGSDYYVECASCHDPHTTANATFLRVSNTGSNVCLTCHNK